MRARESLVVLTQDAALAGAVRAVSSSEHDTVVVQAEADLATHLMGDAAGVVVLDTNAVVSAIAQLTHGLKAQFPDVVLIVAGGAYEQAALAAQVTSGAVYRFLHKPASEQRIRLFIEAAWRRRNAEHATGQSSNVLPKLANVESRGSLALWLGVAAVVVVIAAGVVGWLMGQNGRVATAAPPAAHAAPRPVAPQASSDAAVDQLLVRAADALGRGDLVAPAGSSAADLYRQVLDQSHGNPKAQAGLDKVVDQLLSGAEQNLLAQHLDEADRLTQAAHGIAPDSARISFLTTQIARERERSAHAQARLQLQQQQQQQASALEHQEKLIAPARAAIAAGNLDEAALLITSAADAGADHDAIEALTRELSSTRLVAKINETLAKPAPVPAIETPPLAMAAPVVVPAAPPDTAAVHVNDVVSASTLERLKYVPPEYPLDARAQAMSGWVDIAFDVQTDGSVNDIAVLAAEPKNVFEHAAVTAVRKWRYRPVERDGHPVVRRAQLRIRFAVK